MRQRHESKTNQEWGYVEMIGYASSYASQKVGATALTRMPWAVDQNFQSTHLLDRRGDGGVHRGAVAHVGVRRDDLLRCVGRRGP